MIGLYFSSCINKFWMKLFKPLKVLLSSSRMRVKPVIAYGLLIVEVWSTGPPHQKKQSTWHVLHVSGGNLNTKLHQLNYPIVLRKCEHFNSISLAVTRAHTHTHMYASGRCFVSISVVLEKVHFHIKVGWYFVYVFSWFYSFKDGFFSGFI